MTDLLLPQDWQNWRQVEFASFKALKFQQAMTFITLQTAKLIVWKNNKVNILLFGLGLVVTFEEFKIFLFYHLWFSWLKY